MSQIQGSGTGNYASTAIVDTTADAQHGRLWTNPANGLAIAKGEISGTSFIHKFGVTPDFDTGDNKVTVWDGANDGGIDAMTYTYSTTADIDSVVSTNSTDTQVIEIQGLDADGLMKNQDVTLAGSGYVGLGSSLIRVFRLKNEGTTDFTGDVSVYVSGPTTAGVPDTTSDIRAQVQNSNNQTLMAVYTIPADKTGYMRNWFGAIGGANKSSNYIMDLVARPSGGVFQLKHRSAIADDGTSHIQHQYIEPEKFNAFTDIEMRSQVTTAGVTAATIGAGFDIVLVDN